MKNLFILPTDKPSRLIIYSNLLNEFRLLDEPIEDWKHKKHIYITSDEEIKDGDYYLYLKDNSVQQFIKKHHTKLLALDIQKKIILTTDQDLIKDGVQAIKDEFLEWFVKNPSCEEVDVKNPLIANVSDFGYKIIIPKEETEEEVKYTKVLSENGNELFFDEQGNLIKVEPEQKTLEEVAKILYPNYQQEIFIDGAKWQKTQDKNKFSEEEIRNIAEASFSFYRTNEFSDDELEVEWKNWVEKRIQQLKNK